MAILKTVLRFLIGAMMIYVGSKHFTDKEFFLKIMPDYLPLHLEAVYVSGVCEILLGILLMIPQTTRLAGWGLIALFIAVFPANIYVYQHQELIPSGSPTMHLLRLPLQGVMIALAYWYTRPNRSMPASTPTTADLA